MKDYIMECPTIPSAVFAAPVANGFVGAMNSSFVANPGNSVQVSQFWEGVRIMAANTLASGTDQSTAAVKAALLGNSNDIAARIAPLAKAGSNFTQPSEYAKSIAAFGMYNNASTSATLLASQPAIFPPGYYCPVGQGKDFIKKYRDLSPENPAASECFELGDDGLELKTNNRSSFLSLRFLFISKRRLRRQRGSLCFLLHHDPLWSHVFAQLPQALEKSCLVRKIELHREKRKREGKDIKSEFFCTDNMKLGLKIDIFA